MQIQPYVFFDGRCDEAIAFYRGALGAEVVRLMRYGEGPQSPAAGMTGKVMHAELRIGEATVLVSDGHGRGPARFEGFALSLIVSTEAEAEQRFAALGDGGEVDIALGPTFFSPRFGMVTDRFGVLWIVYVAG